MTACLKVGRKRLRKRHARARRSTVRADDRAARCNSKIVKSVTTQTPRRRMRLPRAAGLVLLLVIYALHVGRRKPADVLPVQDGVLLINATWSVTPAPVSRLEPLYGFATLILSADYVAHALTLCRNLKLGMRPSWPAAHLNVVAFIPADSQARNISTAILRCCFDNVISLPPVVVQRPSRWAKYNEQYIKLGFWAAAEYAGLLYMDVDVHVVEPAVLYHLLVKSNATFAACADFWRNK